MTTRRPVNLPAIIALLALTSGVGLAGGCQGSGEQAEAGPAEPPQVWSSKQRSRIGHDPAFESLDVPALAAPDAPDDVRSSAIELLLDASESTNPLLRANAIEALQSAPAEIEAVARAGLTAENRGVRFVSAMTVGQLRLVDSAHLVNPLLDDPSDSVRAAAIYALRRCGRKVDPTPLGAFIMSPDPEVKGNTAIILGKLGEPTALPMLREAAHRRAPRVAPARARIIDLQIAEAMVRLGAEKEIEVVRAALFVREEQSEIAVLACQMIGRLEDRSYAPALMDKAVRRGRDQEPPEIRLAAVQGLAWLDPTRAPREVPLEYLGSERFELRVQAAATLGALRDPTLVPTLLAMMSDTNALVQVTAAGAILQSTRGTMLQATQEGDR